MSGYPLHEAIRLWLEKKINGEDRTQAKVARALGVKQERLHHWLTGRNRVPLDKLNVIATYFKLESDADLMVAIRREYPMPLKLPETAALVREKLRASRVTTAPRQRPPTQRREAGGRSHGKV